MRVYQFRHLGAVASLATFSLSRCVSCSAAEERDYAYFLKCASHLAFFNYFLSGPVEGASCGDGHVVPWRPVGRPIRAARPSGLVPCQPASTRGTLHQRHGKLPERLLQQFIEDESSALGRGERGAFYPDNHHLITPLIVRAPRLLSEEDRVELYFHLLRGMCARRSRRKASSNCSARPMRACCRCSPRATRCVRCHAPGACFFWPG